MLVVDRPHLLVQLGRPHSRQEHQQEVCTVEPDRDGKDA